MTLRVLACGHISFRTGRRHARRRARGASIGTRCRAWILSGRVASKSWLFAAHPLPLVQRRGRLRAPLCGIWGRGKMVGGRQRRNYKQVFLFFFCFFGGGGECSKLTRDLRGFSVNLTSGIYRDDPFRQTRVGKGCIPEAGVDIISCRGRRAR
ncbi:hypothetical protein N658DRAFT_93221 [Parathielavia hyrcaniae]|uniref:Uncharacterized protein n=1 Tax=Parathielavia hyrcaniae TaxID=113614 RepID=A0AAN6Q1S0_9PEZI|nr:hypothetical protein N658DRAFT_93221 [Parathielavia hyrcaniae]